MLYQQSRSAYQTAAVDGTTLAGLTQLVYTHLAHDLLHAADAMKRKDIQARCTASNHALMLLGHVEDWADGLDDSGLTESLRAFYSMLRTAVVQSQATLDSTLLEESAQRVLDTRAVWKVKEERALSAVCSAVSTSSLETGSINIVV